MQYTEFIHPDDAAALKALQSIPMLSTIIKKVMDVGHKRHSRLTITAIGETQAPQMRNVWGNRVS